MSKKIEAFIDGRPIEVSRPTIAEAFEAVIAETRASGRVIVDATADGAPLPEEMLADPPDTDGGYSQLRFTSAEPEVLVRSTLQDAAAAMPEIRTRQDGAADQIAGADLTEARRLLEESVDIWTAAITALQHSASLLDIDLDDLRIGQPPRSILEPVDALRGNLVALIEGIEAEDWSAVSDLLADELSEEANRWEALLHEIADEIAPAPGSGGGGGSSAGEG